MLANLLEKLKAFWTDWQRDILAGLAVGLVALGSFGLGRLTAPQPKPPVTLQEVDLQKLFVRQEGSALGAQTVNQQSKTQVQGNFLASRNGKRYYPKDCASANRIKPENRIWFASIAEAEKAGYTKATNCP
ncbi:hypothetical protein HYW67_02395 [Candidatus Parcubacteria bacterium]|nr:hypothetical protein [Candidatus Parcubacteria bacterium]